MTIPTWLDAKGLALHALLGAGEAILLHLAGTPLLAILLAVAITGIVHEHDDSVPGVWFSDFQRANGGPWNGLLDVAAFVVGAAVLLAWLAAR